ncbi:likely protein kinase [Pseudozyma hubeiensis SY62]|uniref:Cyclin-dependent kinase 8 n=1 Tax=Pseudozyma hubeiensis (strain SY62) TaxID=1305764 RepID=R9P242_PSEHS|nr:likely protein kinase [Pseudozyma hubeiensis SY62]GAC95262.1 likely protein kinase [Pseudozyma hubeiensis SY62]
MNTQEHLASASTSTSASTSSTTIMSDPIRPSGYFYSDAEDPFAGAFWSQFEDPHDLAARHIPTDSSPAAAMRAYREYRDRVRKPVLATYTILGFLSSGTYGRVYKARLRTPPQVASATGSAGAANPNGGAGSGSTAGTSSSTAKKKSALLQQHQLLDSPGSSLHATPKSALDASALGANGTPTASPGVGASLAGSSANALDRSDHSAQLSGTNLPDSQIYAIKKFKPDSKETDATIYTGISQSAMREISLNRELSHINIVTLHQVMLEDKAIYMVFEYAEHDLLQIIHYHSTALRAPIPLAVLKSLLWQLINGVAYLHANWILHRDLKPANILVTSQGVVKIGDLGLARLYSSPLQSLYNGDKVVVTIWYRAPELLLGARHYTTAIDMWSVGCIWGELLALRPMFKGEEAKMDPKTKAAPFQTDQLKRIVEVLGTPNKDRWPAIESMPDYKGWWPHLRLDNYPKTLSRWYATRNKGDDGYDLFDSLLQYDPEQRLTANQALEHAWFTAQDPKPTANAFSSLTKPLATYPNRRVIQDDMDPKMKSNYLPPIERHHIQPSHQYNLNSSQPHRLAQLMFQQEQLRHQQMQQQKQPSQSQQPSARNNAPGTAVVPVAPIVGGPAAPPPITIGSGAAGGGGAGAGMQSSAPSSGAGGNNPVITIAGTSGATVSNPASVKSTHSIGSIETSTPTTATGSTARNNLVATATRNQQRKRQRI